MARGCRRVAGVDEVGIGPLAGPVVAAAVALPETIELPGLDDSKKLSPSERERLATAIREQAVGVALGEVSAREVDRMNVFRAGLEAMRRAATALIERLEIDHLMVDARTIPDMEIPQTSLIHGDTIDGSIAAASIVAKVYRDGLMQKLEVEHPGYGFGRNMGYGTAEHMRALGRLGASPEHRQSFAPVAATLGR
jgi:ribonuclease HII